MPDEQVLRGDDRDGWWIATVTLQDGRRGDTCATSLAAQSPDAAAMVATAYTELFEQKMLPARGCAQCMQAPSIRCPSAGCASGLCAYHFRCALPASLSTVELTPQTFPPARVAQHWICSVCNGEPQAIAVAPQRSAYVLLSGLTTVAGDKAIMEYETKKMFSIDSDRVATTHEHLKAKSLKALQTNRDRLLRQLHHTPQRRHSFVHLLYLHGSGTGSFGGASLTEVSKYIEETAAFGTALKAREVITVLACCDVAPELAQLLGDKITTPILGFTGPFSHRLGWLYFNALIEHVMDGSQSLGEAIRAASAYPWAKSLLPWTLNLTIDAVSVPTPGPFAATPVPLRMAPERPKRKACVLDSESGAPAAVVPAVAVPSVAPAVAASVVHNDHDHDHDYDLDTPPVFAPVASGAGPSCTSPVSASQEPPSRIGDAVDTSGPAPSAAAAAVNGAHQASREGLPSRPKAPRVSTSARVSPPITAADGAPIHGALAHSAHDWAEFRRARLAKRRGNRGGRGPPPAAVKRTAKVALQQQHLNVFGPPPKRAKLSHT